jgi:molybdate transport system regulatory protein
MKGKKMAVAGRIWIEMEGEDFLGAGRIELLENIEKTGSLRKAAAMMGLSYRKAFYTIKSMNTLAGTPLVEFRRGGKDGGSAKITGEGDRCIKMYREVSQKYVTFITEESRRLNSSGE